MTFVKELGVDSKSPVVPGRCYIYPAHPKSLWILCGKGDGGSLSRL